MAEKKIDEKKAQELYMELNMINQQIQEYQKQIQQFEETIQEVRESKKSLDEISVLEEGKEILLPIVSGIFAKAEIKNTKEFIVNVGANTAVEKPVDDVKKLLDKQLEEIQKTQNNFVDNLQKLTVQSQKLKKEMESSMG
jgi:prefoldin alpha subunit|tara:strand:+ start:170 stop:589 length:420 start_codon:yes stop_codon:yes gene_type:complete